MIGDDSQRVQELELEVARLRRTDSLGEIAATLFGELRCLMAPVSMGNELLAKRLGRDAELGKLAQHAASASALASRLLRETLDYVHQPAPQQARPVQLAEVLAQMHGVLEGLIGQGVELVLEVERGMVRADRLELERMLLNLVCHLRETLHGLNRVTITTRPVWLDGEQARRFGCKGPGAYVVLRSSGRSASGPRQGANGDGDEASNRVQRLARERGWGFSTSQEAGQMPAIGVYLPEER